MSYRGRGLPDNFWLRELYGIFIIMVGAFFLTLMAIGNIELIYTQPAAFLDTALIAALCYDVGALIIFSGLSKRFERIAGSLPWPGNINWEKCVIYVLGCIIGLTVLFYFLLSLAFSVGMHTMLSLPGIDFYGTMGVIALTYVGVAYIVIRTMRPKKPAWQTDYKIIAE